MLLYTLVGGMLAKRVILVYGFVFEEYTRRYLPG
jgi:hypothetical protein